MVLDEVPYAFCWSKMGAEAGESLEAIIQRKEVERIANGGVFTWGVGSSLGDSIDLLRRQESTPLVLFTPIRGKPKELDSEPRHLLLWLSGHTRSGEKVELPPYSLVTSRKYTTQSSDKNKHYALICSSSEPVELTKRIRFDSTQMVNLKTGNAVGSSQVTSVVMRSTVHKGNRRFYEVGFAASLPDPGQIVLDSCVSITAIELSGALEAADDGDINRWKAEVAKLKLSKMTLIRKPI